MKLSDLVCYLQERFPPPSEVVDVQLSLVVNDKFGIIETITLTGGEDDDEPDDDDWRTSATRSNRTRLNLVG